VAAAQRGTYHEETAPLWQLPEAPPRGHAALPPLVSDTDGERDRGVSPYVQESRAEARRSDGQL